MVSLNVRLSSASSKLLDTVTASVFLYNQKSRI
uniref:Uncharacterized protein n=1 Tax=Arundo donax TaxID=35708 RepID=A0A0A9E2G2_ARUDO